MLVVGDKYCSNDRRRMLIMLMKTWADAVMWLRVEVGGSPRSGLRSHCQAEHARLTPPPPSNEVLHGEQVMVLGRPENPQTSDEARRRSEADNMRQKKPEGHLLFKSICRQDLIRHKQQEIYNQMKTVYNTEKNGWKVAFFCSFYLFVLRGNPTGWVVFNWTGLVILNSSSWSLHDGHQTAEGPGCSEEEHVKLMMT